MDTFTTRHIQFLKSNTGIRIASLELKSESYNISAGSDMGGYFKTVPGTTTLSLLYWPKHRKIFLGHQHHEINAILYY